MTGCEPPHASSAARSLPAFARPVAASCVALATSVLVLAIAPALAFETARVNVRTTIQSPVQLSAEEFLLTPAEEGYSPESATFVVDLADEFGGQSRLDGLEYRVVATVEPQNPESAGDASVLPLVECTHDPNESGESSDEADQALLGVAASDTSDRWFVALRIPAAGAAPSESAPAEEPAAATSSASSVTGSETAGPEAPADDTEPALVSRYRVRIRIEIVGYRPVEE